MLLGVEFAKSTGMGGKGEPFGRLGRGPLAISTGIGSTSPGRGTGAGVLNCGSSMGLGRSALGGSATPCPGGVRRSSFVLPFCLCIPLTRKSGKRGEGFNIFD